MQPDHDLPVAAAETVGLDSQRLAGVAARMPGHFADVTSLLVARHGKVAFENYFGIQPHEPQDTQSVTKSVVSLLTGVAIRRGLLKVDQSILGIWPDAADMVADPRWEQVTVDHLLTMTSGLPSEITDPVYDDTWFLNTDPVRFTLNQTLRTRPGGAFHYSNAGVHLLGALLSGAAGQTLEDFASEALLSPLGIPSRPWARDPQGRVWGSGMLHLTPREMLRIGQLVLQGGQWQGSAMVPGAWVRQMTRPRVKGYLFMEGLPEYGRLWWLPGLKEVPGFYATGYGGQYIAIFPALDLVVVMTGRVCDHPSHRQVIVDIAKQVAAWEDAPSDGLKAGEIQEGR